MKHSVALTGRNRTGPPCSVDRPTVHAPGGRPTRRPAMLQTTTQRDDRRRQTTDTCSEQNYTGPLGGPVIRYIRLKCVIRLLEDAVWSSRSSCYRTWLWSISRWWMNEVRSSRDLMIWSAGCVADSGALSRITSLRYRRSLFGALKCRTGKCRTTFIMLVTSFTCCVCYVA